MKKLSIFLVAAVILAGSYHLLTSSRGTEKNIKPNGIPAAGNLTSEKAETTAYNFILDFIKVAPPEPDSVAIKRMMSVLSADVKTKVSSETASADLARFVGVQDVPDQGASVEDLRMVSDKEAYLVVGLNYSGGRVLKKVYLVAEEGSWKVDRISATD